MLSRQKKTAVEPALFGLVLIALGLALFCWRAMAPDVQARRAPRANNSQPTWTPARTATFKKLLLEAREIHRSNILNCEAFVDAPLGGRRPWQPYQAVVPTIDLTRLTLTTKKSEAIHRVWYEPTHPGSNQEGYVRYPNVDVDWEQECIREIDAELERLSEL